MWVRCTRNGLIRYVTKPNGAKHFEDDGKLSGKKPSPYCHWGDYEPLYKYDKQEYYKKR